jgi:hypothetical protein
MWHTQKKLLDGEWINCDCVRVRILIKQAWEESVRKKASVLLVPYHIGKWISTAV